MKYYETLYLISPNCAEDEYREVVNKFNDLIEKFKGEIVKVDEWGKKTLAYTIKKFDKGYYVLEQYCGETTALEEFHRALKLDERILKYQTIKLSDHVDLEAVRAGVQPGSETPSEDLDTEETDGEESAIEETGTEEVATPPTDSEHVEKEEADHGVS